MSALTVSDDGDGGGDRRRPHNQGRAAFDSAGAVNDALAFDAGRSVADIARLADVTEWTARAHLREMVEAGAARRERGALPAADRYFAASGPARPRHRKVEKAGARAEALAPKVTTALAQAGRALSTVEIALRTGSKTHGFATSLKEIEFKGLIACLNPGGRSLVWRLVKANGRGAP